MSGKGNYKVVASACVVVVTAAALSFFPFEYFTSEKNGICFSFHTKWNDPIAGIVKKLQLNFMPADNSVELYDTRAKKLFVKRFPVRELEEKDLYLGNTVVILSRQLKIIDYADEFTKQEISRRRQKTFAMVKPDAVHRIGEILQLIRNRRFDVTQMKMIHWTREQAEAFLEEKRGRPNFEARVQYMSSGPVIGMELTGIEAVQQWRKVLGPTDSEVAREQVPESIRAKFGRDYQENAAHGSDSDASAIRELNFFFSNRSFELGNTLKATALLKNGARCIIKPHAVSEGNVGAILLAITQEGFRISALQMFRIQRRQAQVFLEAYKDIMTEYQRMVQQLTSGPLIAIEISFDGNDETSQTFREMVGPMEPVVARELRPHSLRARFGLDKIRNAIQCTDLTEDSPLEVEYFFQILQ